MHVFDAVHYITVAWNEIKPKVNQNYINKAAFHTANSRGDHITEEEDMF